MMVTENHSTHAAGVQAELHQDPYLGSQDLTRWKNPAGRVMARTAEKIKHHSWPPHNPCPGGEPLRGIGRRVVIVRVLNPTRNGRAIRLGFLRSVLHVPGSSAYGRPVWDRRLSWLTLDSFVEQAASCISSGHPCFR